MKQKQKQSTLASSNEGPRLVLRIDIPEDCLAGTFVSGRVYLALPQTKNPTTQTSNNAPREEFQGIHVRLEGHEHALINVSSGEMTENKSPLILTEQPIVMWSSSTTGSGSTLTTSATSAANYPDTTAAAQHLEYPFRWRLPANLPGSMECRKRNSNSNEQCRIQYQITAFLISRLGEKVHPSVVRMQVRSHAVSTKGQAVQVPKENFKIATALIFTKGTIEFGLHLSGDILAPGSNLRVGVYGCNHSKVAVKDFVIRLVERVTWTVKKKSPDHTASDETVLAEEKIWTQNATDWQANDDRRYTVGETVWNMLRVPDQGCRSTYLGEWIRVEHFVVVIAETSVDMTTNPRLEQAVRVVNASRDDQMLQQNALVLPMDWEPVVAPVMEIPDTLVVPQAQARVVPNDTDDNTGNEE